MLASFSKRPIYTPGGTYLREAGALSVDGSRIENVISRVIRGLYYHHLGQRLPTGHIVWTWSDWFGNLGDQEFLTAFQGVLDALKSEAPKTVGGRVFCYCFRILDDPPDVSVWWLSFYDHRQFLGLTLPRSSE
jgi:hypothetical protein